MKFQTKSLPFKIYFPTHLITGPAGRFLVQPVEWRMVGGTSYSRRGDLEWAQMDDEAFESVQRLGLDGPVTVEQILDPLTAEYASSTTCSSSSTQRSRSACVAEALYR